MADGNEWAAERLTREPGWVLDSALRSGNSKVFAAHLGGRVDSHDIASLRLGKKAEAAYERAGELTRALDRYAYHVDVRFDDSEIDQARAAGVVIEFERSAPIIVDRSLYRELVKAAITRTVAELEAKVAAREQERKTARQSQKSSGAPADPAAEAEREHRQRMRRAPDQAHGVNLDVGAGLLNGLSTVDPDRRQRRKGLRLQPSGRRLRRFALHPAGRAGRAAGRVGDPAGDRGVPRRRDQDPQGRVQGRAADRLRQRPRAAGARAVAVEVR